MNRKYFSRPWLAAIAFLLCMSHSAPSNSQSTHVHGPVATLGSDAGEALDGGNSGDFSQDIIPLVVDVKQTHTAAETSSMNDRPFYLNNCLYEFLLLNMKDRSFLLDSPIIKKEEDFYQPVRFMHAKHASLTQHCTVCHHYKPAAPESSETTRCSACHQESFNLEVFGRLGLKGAYHRLCMDCHIESRNVKAPIDCLGCHRRNVPDHNELVELPDNPSPSEVTRECLRCHEDQAEHFQSTSHWLWKTPSPHPGGLNNEIGSGKATTSINNSLIALDGNLSRCTNCHCGYGWEDKNFDFSDKSRMDCLVCHDTTGSYKKDPDGAGMPAPGVDLVTVAKNVGKPSRKTCGACHFQGDGDDPTQHAYLNSLLLDPPREFDVHMGGLDFQCQDCHKTRNHNIAGKSSSLPTAEGTFSCEDCHTHSPHSQGPLIYHLNTHSKHVACTTCHAPLYAKSRPTKTWWDWSKAGDQNRETIESAEGMPDYMWKYGEFKWQKNRKPEYAWYNGNMERYQIGEQITTGSVFNITQPIGSIHDPNSKIYPFQVLRGKQPADAETNILLTPSLAGPGAYWDNLDWDTAFENGMREAGLSYSGTYRWQETAMYWSIEHEVMPKEYAIPCSQCHTSLKTERTCDRCHQDSESLNYQELSNRGMSRKSELRLEGGDSAEYINGSDYIDFKKLGYEGDPIEVGGRFKILPLGHIHE